MRKFGYVSGIIIVIVGLIEFSLGLFYGKIITGVFGYISMQLGAIAIALNDDETN